MAVQSTTGSSGNAYIDSLRKSTATTKKNDSSMQATQDRFLQLLVTQLKNQDPMNPMDNAQMTSQLAQMSTVSGIEKLNATVNSMMGGLSDIQAMQATNMIGQNVLVSGDAMYLAKGAAFGGVSLSAPAETVTISIKNAAGKVVQTQVMEKQDAGNIAFAWDGKNSKDEVMPDGKYTFTVTAKTASGSTVPSSTLSVGTVSALAKSGNGFLLDLGPLGKFDFSKVQEVFKL